MKYFLNVSSGICELQAEFRAGWDDLGAKRDRAFGRRNVTENDWRIIRAADGTGDMGYALLASNGRAANKIVKEQLRGYSALHRADPGLQFAHVTICNDAWTTSDEQTVIDLKGIIADCRPILSGMASDWQGVVEIAAFSNVRHPDGGKMLAPHSHTVIIGHDILPRAQEVAAQWNGRMTASVEGAKAIVVRPIGPTYIDRARVIRYPWKAHDRCKNVYINREKGIIDVNETQKTDRWIRYLRVFQIHSMLEMNRMCFASGRGKAIKSATFRETFAWLGRRVERATRSVHVEEMTDFWREFMPRMGWDRFALPIIRLR